MVARIGAREMRRSSWRVSAVLVGGRGVGCVGAVRGCGGSGRGRCIRGNDGHEGAGSVGKRPNHPRSSAAWDVCVPQDGQRPTHARPRNGWDVCLPQDGERPTGPDRGAQWDVCRLSTRAATARPSASKNHPTRDQQWPFGTLRRCGTATGRERLRRLGLQPTGQPADRVLELGQRHASLPAQARDHAGVDRPQ